jgi:hypothetical protein
MLHPGFPFSEPETRHRTPDTFEKDEGFHPAFSTFHSGGIPAERSPGSVAEFSAGFPSDF